MSGLPQKIGRYEVRDRLGEGAFGVVYKAWDPQFEFEVAIKLCKPLDDGTQSAEAVERFKREARTAAQLQHPNIVPVRDMGSIRVRGQVQPYFVMPFIPGTTLADEIKTGKRFSDAEIVQLVSGIDSGLQYAHTAGLVHRDIKPANIMLDATGNPLIADFGMVYAGEASQALSQTGHMLGTPAYMPPEQVKYIPGEIDGRADIYSLGVVMYELLCGDIPYQGTAMSVMFNIVNGTPYPKPGEILNGVNPQLEQICLTSMAHAKAQRYATAPEMFSALQSVLATGSTLLTPSLPPETSPAGTATAVGVTLAPPVEETPGREAAAFTINTGLPGATRRLNTHRRKSNRGPHRAVWWIPGITISLVVGLALYIQVIAGGGQDRNANDAKVSATTPQPPQPQQANPVATPTPQASVATTPTPAPQAPAPPPVANTAQNIAATENGNPIPPIPQALQPPASQFTNSVGMTMVLIPPGEFLMGSPASEKGRVDDEQQHQVQLTKSFYLQTTEVTQGQWQEVMDTKPWQGKYYIRAGANYPATYVSWDDAVAFCHTLSQREGKTYRLPMEAEWEYACRAGTTTVYSFGDNPVKLNEYAWYRSNAWDKRQQYPHEVGLKRPNPFGLSDMHGNVREWCSDRYDRNYFDASTDSNLMAPGCLASCGAGRGPGMRSTHVLRIVEITRRTSAMTTSVSELCASEFLPGHPVCGL